MRHSLATSWNSTSAENAAGPGWAKLNSTRDGTWGVVNVEWDADTCTLLCRIMTKLGSDPSVVAGDLVA